MKALVVVNCGSSSVKLDVFELGGGNPLQAKVERVGGGDAELTVELAGQKRREALGSADHARAVAALLDAVEGQGFEIVAVGHRVVHGGEKLTESVRIDATVLAAIEACAPLAPLHNPANVLGICAVSARMPNVPQVAVFDTAFHSTLPPSAYLYAIPREFHRERAMRRYGFHGTSHHYVSTRAYAMLGRSDAKLVTLHLGNGCSACAVDAGKSVDTTMGMTPLEGLVMGTRSGDLDPALVLQLARELGIESTEQLLNKKSGLLGLSGQSQDMRDLLERSAAGDADAALAIEVFVRRARKSVGALAAAMGGLDAIVFTGGIGEHAATVREGICRGLAFLGAELDVAANQRVTPEERDVAKSGSRGRILVIATDEERAIADDSKRVLGLDG